MRATFIVIAVLLLLCGAVHAAELRPGAPLEIRILYDNSGSMYPGYTPPGPSERRTKAELNVRYLHEYPEFRQWLADFVQLQTVVGGGTVAMSTFTSDGAFDPGRDLQQVHPPVRPAAFRVDEAVRNFPTRRGQTTDLVDSLRTYTDGFTGLVWLITDNVVETSAGVPDTGVDEFFEMLDREERFRSVHLFKLPFLDPAARQQATLAVYGLIVSPVPLSSETLAWYDRKFREGFRLANRPSGNPAPPLFPGREHLKLKDLRVDALELVANTNLELLLSDPDRGVFKEGQNIRLGLTGEIKSYLTQHSVTAGRYRLRLAAPFTPEETARRNFNLPSLAAAEFEETADAIRQPIPPNGRRAVTAVLQSAQPVSLSPDGFGAWVRLALQGAQVRYTGTVQMSFEDVAVRLEPARMEGIFGIERAPAIFRLQDVKTLTNVQPSTAQVGFTLAAKANRTVVLLLVLAAISAVAGVVAYILSRKQWYRVRISNAGEQLIPLRRLGRHSLEYEKRAAGSLSRGIAGDTSFTPATGVTLDPGGEGLRWRIRFRDGVRCEVAIEPVGGAALPAPRKTTTAPTASTVPRGAGPPARRPLPKIDRP
jgi:hypothetical protein